MSKRGFTLGITGGIGSGKTSVSNFFAEFGASIIDTDVIAHELCKPNGMAMPLIKLNFGEDFIQADGAMNRSKMRELIFKDAQVKQQLESILHPLIRQQTELMATQSTGLYAILVIPLLIESKKWVNRLDRILVIDCKEETQIQRVMQRNGFNREQVLQIMATQVNRHERLQYADDLINTENDFATIRQQVEVLHKKYVDLCTTMQIN
jgi:dephospho-CoA kinase